MQKSSIIKYINKAYQVVRAEQRGSILNFVIIGGLLAILLIGGAYVARHTLSPASSGTPSSQGGDEPSEQPTDEDQDDTEETTSDNEQDTDEVVLPGGSSVDVDRTPESESPTNLPQTGPADALLRSFMFGTIAAAAIAYKRSRNLSSTL